MAWRGLAVVITHPQSRKLASRILTSHLRPARVSQKRLLSNYISCYIPNNLRSVTTRCVCNALQYCLIVSFEYLDVGRPLFVPVL